MNSACKSFRHELRQALELKDVPLHGLLWHKHLHTCEDCRDLLAAEEALDALLSSLPHPKLPPGLTQRVLARLARQQTTTANLDALLDLDRPERARPGLADRVLAHLAEERALAGRAGRDLDTLLELARPVKTPDGLARRTLSAVRASSTVSTRGVLLRWRWAAAAAVLVVLLGVYAFYPREQRTGPVVALQDQPDAGMLENLKLLEEWELLEGADLEILLSTLPGEDEYLLELDTESPADQGGQPRKG